MTFELVGGQHLHGDCEYGCRASAGNKTTGSQKAPLGMCRCWHGFQDVWLALLGFFLFSLMSENNTAIYAQACKCDWTSCNTLKMQQVSHDG